MTWTHTPRRKGLPSKAGDFDFVHAVVSESGEGLGKEVEATLRQNVGKNFLAKSYEWSQNPSFGLGSR
jgi:hypothetical protein